MDSAKSCLNCAYELDNSYKFCPNCGQETGDKVVSFKSFISDFLGDYFTFDSKIFRSVWPLLVKPGFLTLEYLEGKRVKYILPLRLYVFISIVFFLLLSLESANERLAEDQMVQGTELSEKFFDEFFNNQLPKLFFILLPIFAFILKLLFNKKRKLYLGHFIFSLHFHSFIFILFSFYLVISLFELNQTVYFITLLFFAFLSACYLFIALHKVYKDTVFYTSLKFVLLIGLYLTVLTILSLFASYLYYQFKYS